MSKSPGSAAKEWDLIIQPKTAWLDLHLADLWRYRDLTMLFVWRDFVAQYKQTILGPLWHILQPLITTIVFTIIFGKMAKLSTDDLPLNPHFRIHGPGMNGIAANTALLGCAG